MIFRFHAKWPLRALPWRGRGSWSAFSPAYEVASRCNAIRLHRMGAGHYKRDDLLTGERHLIQSSCLDLEPCEGEIGIGRVGRDVVSEK
jgi:hypothetical protein